MSYSRSKTQESIKLKPLFRRRSIGDTKTLFKRTNTKPIQIGKIFDGGHRDAYYHKSFTQEAQRAEKELFFEGEDEESKNTNTGFEVHHKPNWAMKLNIYDPEFNQEKMDKILVATCMVWDDTNYNQNLIKLELLVQANADINTKQGGGMFKQTLLTRMMYEGERKLRLQRALINFADKDSLEPRVGKTPLEIVSSSYNYEIMRLLLDKNCEPNRIAKNGLTPLITICRYNSRNAGDEQTKKRLKCLKLLVNHEGPDARELKNRYAKQWNRMCPDGIEQAWYNVADFCIPNINVRPAYKEKNVADYLQSYDNPCLFDSEGLELVGRLCKDAAKQKEKYWPKDRQEYIKLFEPRWAKDDNGSFF